MKILLRIVLAALLIVLENKASSQNISSSYVDTIDKHREQRHNETITLPAGAQYKASGWKQLWWGRHYRSEWLTPVAFPYLDWNGTKGGLKPLRMGGGHETKTLRVLGGDQKEYVLRTMDKDLTLKVPSYLRGTYLNDAVNDQISIAHPYSPLVIARLAEAAGLPHTNPLFYYVPENKIDSTFNDVFAGKICMLEERPSGKGWTYTSLTGNADAVINTEKLLQNIGADSKYRVDQKAFLYVRLFDMIINDWDRHDDQWVWTAHKQKGQVLYKPFARDRDQAFARTDGINLYVLSRPWAIRSLQNFNPRIKDVIGQNLAALPLDRQFLNALSKDDWKAALAVLQSKLTDEVIHTAVLALPDTIRALSGNYLEQRLQQRREHLLEDALRYYQYLNKEVDVIGTAANEIFTINNISPSQVQITVHKKKGDGHAGAFIYQRTFYHSETSHINIYGLGGNDQYRVMGLVKSSIFVRAIGGEGQDQYTGETRKADTKRSVRIYETDANVTVDTLAFNSRISQDSAYRSYDRKAFKPDWHQVILLPSYNVDDGVLLGLGFTYKKRGWMKEPYAWVQHIGASIALGTGAPSFNYEGRFTKLVRTWDLGLTAIYNGPLYVYNFYGMGNDTRLLIKDQSYYRVHARELMIAPYLAKAGRSSEVRVGLRYQSVSLKNNEERFINTQADKLDPKVFSMLQFGGIWGTYAFAKRDEALFPMKGLGWNSAVSWIHALNKGNDAFIRIEGAAHAYLPIGPLVLAHRTGASTLSSNDYQFYQASTLDGHTNLRGYWRDRFAGRTAFYQNTELRYKIHNAKGYILRGSFGIYGFFDDGRVWIPEEHSTTWHTGYGGGIFIIPYNFIVFTATYGVSKEVTTITLKAGFFF